MIGLVSVFLAGFSTGLEAQSQCDIARMYISNTTHDLIGTTILGDHIVVVRDASALFTHRGHHLDFGNWSIAVGALRKGYIAMEEGFDSKGTLSPSRTHPDYCEVFWSQNDDAWLPRPESASDDFFMNTAFSKLGGANYEYAMYDANRISEDDDDYFDFVEASDVGWSSSYFEEDIDDYDYSSDSEGDESYEDSDGSSGFEGTELNWQEFEWIVAGFRDTCKENEACLSLYKMPTEGAFWRAQVARKRRQ